MKRTHIETVKNLKIEKYLGKWHEVARLPNWFQCDNKLLSPLRIGKNATAEYELTSKNEISVVNTHQLVWRHNFLRRMFKTTTTQSKGVAVTRKHVKSELTVNFNVITRFINLIKQKLGKPVTNYMIVKVLEEKTRYEFSVVLTPNKKYAWILSRKNPCDMNEDDIEDVLDLIHELEFRGVDTGKLIKHDKLP